MRKFKFAAAVLALVAAAPVLSQETYGPGKVNPYLDPALQDYVEMAYGYRNPAYAPGVPTDFRDSLTSITVPGLKTPVALKASGTAALVSIPAAAPKAAVKPAVPGQYYKVTFANEGGPLSAFVAPLDPGAISGFKAGDYVFVSVLPGTADHTGLINGLSGAGFKFSGERNVFSGSGKKTFLLGWAPYAALTRICGHPGVRAVSVEKKAAGMPLKTGIRFTLKAPAGEGSDAFVADFLKQLGLRTGFASETVLRLPRTSSYSKFVAFDVTGSLPVDMVGELSQSPFVAAVEFNDRAL